MFNQLYEVRSQISNYRAGQVDSRLRCDISYKARSRDPFTKLVFNCTTRFRETLARSTQLNTRDWLEPVIADRKQLYPKLHTGHGVFCQDNRQDIDRFSLPNHLMILWNDFGDNDRLVGRLFMNEHTIDLSFTDDVTEGQRKKNYQYQAIWQNLPVGKLVGDTWIDSETGEVLRTAP